MPHGIQHPATSQSESDSFRLGGLRFDRATTPEDIEQIHQLNYKSLVQELGQYPDDGSGRHVDKFHDKNLYFLCRRDSQVIGMVSGHGQAPFSVSGRLEDPGSMLQSCPKPFEVRLLTVVPGERRGFVLMGLLYSIHRHALAAGYSHLVISGVSKQVPLYQRIGFAPLGPATIQGDAEFTPMALDLSAVPPASLRLSERFGRRLQEDPREGDEFLSLLPGPPVIHPWARRAFQSPHLYHRSPSFLVLHQSVRASLARLLGGKEIALLSGTGTLANDAVAACLAALPGNPSGIVLANGAFGERVQQQARAAGLSFTTHSSPWGLPWAMKSVESALAELSPGDWVWAVQLETSTGVANPAESLARLCSARGLRLCLDAVSAVGCLPVPQGADLVSGVGGKCLGAYPGVSFVGVRSGFLDCLPAKTLPPALDLPLHLRTRGPVNTFPSGPLAALLKALKILEDEGWEAVMKRQESLGNWVRDRLRAAGLVPLAPEVCAAPVVATFPLPPGMDGDSFDQACMRKGFLAAAQSGYLKDRGWAQVAWMGHSSREILSPPLDFLVGEFGQCAPATPVAQLDRAPDF